MPVETINGVRFWKGTRNNSRNRPPKKNNPTTNKPRVNINLNGPSRPFPYPGTPSYNPGFPVNSQRGGSKTRRSKRRKHSTRRRR